MTWKHTLETRELHEQYDSERARIWKDGDGRWRATVWPDSLAHGKYLGDFGTAKAAKAACEILLGYGRVVIHKDGDSRNNVEEDELERARRLH